MMTSKLDPIEIEGIKYYSLQQFSFLTGLTEQTIRLHCKEAGQYYRQLRHIVIGGRRMVDAREFTEYVWKSPGNRGDYYRFDEEGNKIITDEHGQELIVK